MLIVVTYVSSLVHLYSIEYMSGDPHYPMGGAMLTVCGRSRGRWGAARGDEAGALLGAWRRLLDGDRARGRGGGERRAARG